MNKTLSFSEVLNVEELAPTELDAIVGGKFGLKIIGANGHQCSCGNGTRSTPSTPSTPADSTSTIKP